jgi:predicted site-specific integrase-resolvase
MSYRTALRWWRAGAITGYQAPTGTIVVPEGETPPAMRSETVPLYACISSAEHEANLERQAARLAEYCAARGYPVTQVANEVASGANDSRPKLLSLLLWIRAVLASGWSTEIVSLASGFTISRPYWKRKGIRWR